MPFKMKEMLSSGTGVMVHALQVRTKYENYIFWPLQTYS